MSDEVKSINERLVRVETTLQLSVENLNKTLDSFRVAFTAEIKSLSLAIEKLSSNQEKFDGAIVTIANNNNRLNKLEQEIKALQKKVWYFAGMLAVFFTIITNLDNFIRLIT